MFTKTLKIQKYIAVTVMVMALFIGATSGVARAQATTIVELQAMIAQLMAQIAVLSGTESETSGGIATDTVCEDFSRTLYLGSRDASTNGDVTRLQKFLTTTGHYTYGAPTGYYGPATAEAVQRWQKTNGVVSSGTPDTTGYGMFGPSTRAKLRTACVGVETPTTPGASAANISIESPRNGTDYLPGDYVTIKWNSKNLKNHTAVVTLTGNNVERHIARNINMNAGSARVKIPVSDALGAVTEGAYTLTLAIVNVKDGAPEDVRASVAIDITSEEEDEDEMVYVEEIDAESERSSNGTMAIFELTFAVTAGDETIYLQNRPGYFDAAGAENNFVNFTIMRDGVAVPRADARYTVDVITEAENEGTTDAPVYMVEAGGTEEFTVSVNVSPRTSGNYSVHLEGPLYYSHDNTFGGSDDARVAFKEFATPDELLKVDGVPASCISGGVSYPDGTIRTSIVGTNGVTQTLADAHYVCRYGTWKIEGGLPKPTTPSFTTSISGLVLTTKFMLNNGCAGYTILWGDGTQSTRVNQSSGAMCTQVVTDVTLEHTYATAGTYTITLKRFNGGTQVATESKTVTVGTTAVTGTYIGYMNGSQFILTRDIALASARENCAMNARNNATAKVHCTWNNEIIFDNRTATTELVMPEVNHFACDRSESTKTADGKPGCYGMWDYGDAFGDDADVCGTLTEGKTGCTIKTPVCSSGRATATRYIANARLTGTLLDTVATRLKVTTSVAKEGVAGLWEYTCTPATVTVLGASISLDSVMDDLTVALTALTALLQK